jgi:mercuric ion transport protein
MRAMTNKKLLKIGLIGTIVAALCCFTPILVVLLGIVGLSAIVGSLDYVLFLALAFFVTVTVYALWRYKTAQSN